METILNKSGITPELQVEKCHDVHTDQEEQPYFLNRPA